VANLSDEQLRRLARLGAVARLEQIKDEEAAIRAEFPELFGGSAAASGRGRGRRGRRGRPPASESAGAPAARRRAGRPAMSEAQKRAVSVLMKKYWAERRKAKASGR
jgi:hypothetical protein